MQEKGIINSFSAGKNVCLVMVSDKTPELTRFFVFSNLAGLKVGLLTKRMVCEPLRGKLLNSLHIVI